MPMERSFLLIAKDSMEKSWNNFHGVFWLSMVTMLEKDYFGEVIGGHMKYSASGEALKYFLHNANLYFPEIAVPAFVVFPGGFDAMIVIHKAVIPNLGRSDIVSIIYNLMSKFRFVTVRSKVVTLPLHLNLWIRSLQKVERGDLGFVFDTYEKRISTWLDKSMEIPMLPQSFVKVPISEGG